MDPIRRWIVFCGVLLLCAARAAGSDRLPVTGCERPELDAVDAAVFEFMRENDIPGATVAIARDGVVLYERGFGHSDEARSIPMQPDALLRIASVSKPLTIAAVRDLIDEGAFTLDSFAFDLGQPGGGLLRVEPFPALGDPRLATVRVRHLIDHEGGWDRDAAGDLTYRELRISKEMGVDHPPGRANTLRWILGRPLQFTPGERRAYSNIGCLVLGLIVEEQSGVRLDRFIHERILAPLGVEDSDHAAGRSLAVDQDPREPFYHSPGRSTSVFDPSGPAVPTAYGGWHHEARVGQGGQIATAATLALAASARWVNGPRIGLPKPPTLEGTWRWNHTGTLAGTGALIRQRGDGISYGVLFNTRGHASEIRGVLDAVLDGIRVWPDGEPSCSAPRYENDDEHRRVCLARHR